MQTKQWFDVDKKGLEKILRRRGIEFAVFELIQNSWDEEGVTKVFVSLEPIPDTRLALLTIQDDAPQGFKNLSHAFTLFADSEKKTNAEQRGRFNLGEKLVLALCKTATIETTTGTVRFDESGRSVRQSRHLDKGSILKCSLKITREEIEQVNAAIKTLIPPATIETYYNGTLLEPRKFTATFAAPLPTEIGDEEGQLRKSTRTTAVHLYPVNGDEPARIYEMGIPVVEHDCLWHCDIQQKVQLTIDRENVSPAFLKALRVAVFNYAHAMVPKDRIGQEWTQTAIESPDVEPEAVKDYMEKRFGKLRVSYDMSDPEANNNAVARGYTLVHGGMMTGAAWANVKRCEAIRPAGDIFPTHSKNFVMHEPAQVTPAMEEIRQYAIKMADVLMDFRIYVEFGQQASSEAANWGGNRLQFNVPNLGELWFDLTKNRLAIDDLLIHEFGHHYESNHLSSRYHEALTMLAAKAMKAIREGKL
jgi:hypothetical protein